MDEILCHKDIVDLSNRLNYKFSDTNKEIIYEAIYDSICIYLDKFKGSTNKSNSVKLAFIYKTANNILLKHIEKTKIEIKYEKKVYEMWYNLDYDEQEKLIKEEKLEQLAEAVYQLSILELEIICWHHFHNMKLKDIAGKKNLKIEDIKKKHSRSLNKLKIILTPPLARIMPIKNKIILSLFGFKGIYIIERGHILKMFLFMLFERKRKNHLCRHGAVLRSLVTSVMNEAILHDGGNAGR